VQLQWVKNVLLEYRSGCGTGLGSGKGNGGKCGGRRAKSA